MRLTAALSLFALLVAPLAAKADNFSLDTGSATYVVTGVQNGPAQIMTVYPGAWTATIPGAKWVNVSGAECCTDPAGVYNYSTSFTATGFDKLSGLFAADNYATVYVDGVALASDNYSDGYTTETPYSVLIGPGLHTLEFSVTNGNLTLGGSDGAGPTGLLASANVSSTPEPSSLVLLGTGILGLAGAARRRLRS